MTKRGYLWVLSHVSNVHYLLLGPNVREQLLLLLPLMPPLHPSTIHSPTLLQGGRSFLLRGWVISQLPAANLAVIQPALPRAVSLVLDQISSYERG